MDISNHSQPVRPLIGHVGGRGDYMQGVTGQRSRGAWPSIKVGITARCECQTKYKSREAKKLLMVTGWVCGGE